jgi:hypothetical protein
MIERVGEQYRGEEQSLHRSSAHEKRSVSGDIGRARSRLEWDVQHRLTPKYYGLQFLLNGVG